MFPTKCDHCGASAEPYDHKVWDHWVSEGRCINGIFYCPACVHVFEPCS